MNTNEKVKNFAIKSFQKSDFEHKITLIPLYQNEGYSLAEDEGFDRIKERLGQALAGGAHPRRIKMGSNSTPLNAEKEHTQGSFQ